MSRVEKAKNLFLSGYACSQSVLLAFSDFTRLDEDTAGKLSLPLGGGVGRLRMTCGAVTGMALVLGFSIHGPVGDPLVKKEVYAHVQEVCARFKQKYGALVCAELLEKSKVKVEIGGAPEERTTAYYQKRSCAELVAFAVEILEEYLTEKGLI